MFKFLKDKLKGAISKFSKKVEEDPEDVKEEVEETIEEVEETVEKVEEELKEPVEDEPVPESVKEPVPEPVKEEPVPEPVEEVKDEPIPETIVEKPIEEELVIEEPVPEVKEEPVPEPVKEPVIEEVKEEPIPETVEEVKEEPVIEEKPPEVQKTEKLVEEIVEKDKVIEDIKPEEIKPDKEVEQALVEEKQEIKELEKEPEKKGFFKKLFSKKEKKEPVVEEVKEDIIEDVKEEVEEEPVEEPKVEKKSIFKKITAPLTTTTLSEKKFEELFWELEVALMENNVAVEVIEKIKSDLKNDLTTKPLRRGKIVEEVLASLKKSLGEILTIETFDIMDKIKEKKPYVICFVGVNGSGKTTSIAKFAKYLMNHDKSVVLAASDTFRAAAIDQLQKHADALDVKLIKHDYGSDPAAVAFDAVEHAKAKHIDVVLIDTAGRLHSNDNLVDEMKKIIRVSKPDSIIFVGESITGNDCVEQAKQFNEAVGLDGIILSKADVDEKGGAAVSVSYVTKKPVLFIGVGQKYEDLEKFDSEKIMGSLGL